MMLSQYLLKEIVTEEEFVDALGQRYEAPRSLLVEDVHDHPNLFRERGMLV